MSAHQYDKPSEGLKDLTEAYNYWSGKLTESSITFALGLIAANWAVFGAALKTTLLPRLSVAFALGTLLVAALTALVMSLVHDRRHEYAEADPKRWAEDFERAKKAGVVSDPWPYTRTIERIGYWSRWARFLFPVVGCAFFLLSFDW